MATVIEPFKDHNRSNIRIEIQDSPHDQADVVVRTARGLDRWIVNLENKNGISVDGKDRGVAVYFSRIKKGQVTDTFTVKFEK